MVSYFAGSHALWNILNMGRSGPEGPYSTASMIKQTGNRVSAACLFYFVGIGGYLSSTAPVDLWGLAFGFFSCSIATVVW